jgi:hypothetical protein
MLLAAKAFSFFGSALCTTSFLGQLGSTTGKVYFTYNLLNTLAYGYFIYLTLLYNKSVPDPREKRRVYGIPLLFISCSLAVG